MKKFLTAAVIFAMTVIMSVMAFAGNYATGDVDGNKTVNAADARKALRASAKLEELTGDAFDAADVDFSGKITASDARMILRVAAKLDTFKAEPTTEEPSSEEPTTEEPTSEEPSTEEPTSEEPTSEEPTTDPNADKEIDAATYEFPSQVKAMLSGVFGFSGTMKTADDSAATAMSIYTDGKSVKMNTVMDVEMSKISISFLSLAGEKDSNTLFMIDENHKNKLILNEATLAVMKSVGLGDINFDDFVVDIAPSKGNTKTTLGKRTIDSTEYDAFTFYSDEGKTVVYLIGDDIKMVETFDTKDVVTSTIIIDKFYDKLPDKALSADGYTSYGTTADIFFGRSALSFFIDMLG